MKKSSDYDFSAKKRLEYAMLSYKERCRFDKRHRQTRKETCRQPKGYHATRRRVAHSAANNHRIIRNVKQTRRNFLGVCCAVFPVTSLNDSQNLNHNDMPMRRRKSKERKNKKLLWCWSWVSFINKQSFCVMFSVKIGARYWWPVRRLQVRSRLCRALSFARSASDSLLDELVPDSLRSRP